MSSFRRKAPPAAAPGALVRAGAGVKPFVNGQALVSSGLSQLDAFLGGGLLLGSVSLLEAPAASPLGGSAVSAAAAGASRALVDDLHRYFVAEGAAAGQRGVVVAEDAEGFVRLRLPLELSRAQALAKRTPQRGAKAADSADGSADGSADEERGGENKGGSLTIAWQYGKYDGAQEPPSRFCHSFDLSKPMQAALLAGARAPAAIDPLALAPPAYASVRAAYAELYARIEAAADAPAEDADAHYMRVCVRELGSPVVGPPTAEHAAALLWFVRKLRALAAGGGADRGAGGRGRPRRVVCQLSGAALASAFPAAMTNELRHACDYVLQLRAFAGARDLLPPELGDFHGLLELRKLARVHALAAFAAPATRLGLKRDHRKLRVEKLHLVPEASRSSSGKPQSTRGGALDPLAF